MSVATEGAAAGSWGQALAAAWRLARPYWRGAGGAGAWGLLAAVAALTLASVGLSVLFNGWNSRFYNALQERDLPAFWQQLLVFAGLALLFIVAAVYRQYLQQRLLMRWRTWMTHAFVGRWLAPGTAYRLGAGEGSGVDNPDQRIAEDVRDFVSSTLDLAIGLLNAGVSLLSFVGILWGLSGALHVPWPGAGWTLPGYMVWVALLYALAGSWITQRIGRPLIGLNAQQQRTEADFRYGLVQVRDHAEAIALARGEPAEQRRLAGRFDAVRANWERLIRRTKRLTWFTVGYAQVANVFPIVAAAPRYFANAIELGGLMQTAQAFGQVQSALSWFIDAYGSLADWRATVLRLDGYSAAMQADEEERSRPEAAEVAPDAARQVLMLQALQVATPQGATLLEVEALQVAVGERWLITGPSGSGKSSLLRTLAGLWQPAAGRLQLPPPRQSMFVPQRPYLPDGRLAEALAYPRPAGDFAQAALQQALRDVGLGRLVAELETSAAWSTRLSPGEQQRLQVARLLLQRPRWIFLDEITSALDDAAAQQVYRCLRDQLPRSTILSIGHRSGLRAWHERHAVVSGGRLNVPPHSAAVAVATPDAQKV